MIQAIGKKMDFYRSTKQQSSVQHGLLQNTMVLLWSLMLRHKKMHAHLKCCTSSQCTSGTYFNKMTFPVTISQLNKRMFHVVGITLALASMLALCSSRALTAVACPPEAANISAVLPPFCIISRLSGIQ